MTESIDLVIQNGHPWPHSKSHSSVSIHSLRTGSLTLCSGFWRDSQDGEGSRPRLSSGSPRRRPSLRPKSPSGSSVKQEKDEEPLTVQEEQSCSQRARLRKRSVPPHKQYEIREEEELSASDLTGRTLNGSFTSGGSSDIMNLFSSEVFQIAINNPTTAYRFLKFCQSRNCGEAMEFLQKVCQRFSLLAIFVESASIGSYCISFPI